MAKSNVDLICSVAELSGLFEKGTGLQSFLQKVVSVIAWHMKAAVCSVFMFDEDKQELVLTANQGLNPSAIGNLRMKLGEGIVGNALLELRPIIEGMSRNNPHFKYIPGIGEENFQAFLAVPILRGMIRVGVLAVQDPEPSYFDDNDAKALRAIASQLAGTIENAKLLMNLHGREEHATPQQEALPLDTKYLHGISGSTGIATGGSIIFDNILLDVTTETTLPAITMDDFNKALDLTEEQLNSFQKDMEERLADVASLIFSAHLLILRDAQFSGAMLKLIEQGTHPAIATSKVVEDFCRLFVDSNNTRLQEKVHDVRDLGSRILRNLLDKQNSMQDCNGGIIIAESLLPSDLVRMSAQKIGGIVLTSGGATAHLSILARSLALPMVIIHDKRLLKLPMNTPLIIDAEQGSLLIRPDAEVTKSFETLKEVKRRSLEIEDTMQPETQTSDGTAVKLLANVNLLSDLEVVHRLKAEGIGLYRTEFPFIVRNDFPSEEEQYRVYRKMLEGMPGREVVFRTLDVGGDKMLSYFQTGAEANPFLGLRAIRLSLRYRNIFAPQIRALLRAGAGCGLRIMFPMISSVDDLIEARNYVKECIAQLKDENVPHNNDPLLGVMIELPAAVELIEELAYEVDFMSIGSNDLVQYILAVDRTNEQIADLYMPHHPAVLRSLKRIADAALKFRKHLSICGDIAACKTMLPFLLGIGIRKISVDIRRLPQVQQIISSIDITQARAKAMSMLQCSRISEIQAIIDPDSSINPSKPI